MENTRTDFLLREISNGLVAAKQEGNMESIAVVLFLGPDGSHVVKAIENGVVTEKPTDAMTAVTKIRFAVLDAMREEASARFEALHAAAPRTLAQEGPEGSAFASVAG